MASGFGLNGGMYFSLRVSGLKVPQNPGVAQMGRPPVSLSRGRCRLMLMLCAGPSRCYNFWQEVLGCYVVNGGEGEAGKKKCVPALDDYYECLHHRKEVRAIPVRPRYLHT